MLVESKGRLSKKLLVKVAIICSHCGKEKMIYVDILDTNYQYIIEFFVLNTRLHHVDMLWRIENNEELKHDMDIQNSDCLTGSPWYNTYICN